MIKPYIKENILKIVIFEIVTLISAFIAILLPLVAGNFIDRLLANKSTDIITNFILIYLILSIINLFLGYIISRLGMILKTKIMYKLNRDIINRIKQYSLSDIENYNLSQLNQQLSNDCSVFVNYFFNLISNLVLNITIILIVSIILISTNTILFVNIILIIIIFIFWYKYFKKIVYESHKNFTDKNYKFYSALYEQLTTIKISRLYNLYKYFNDRLKYYFVKFFDSAKRNQKITFIFSSTETIATLLGQIGLFLIGGYGIMNGSISIGIYSILTNYFNLLINSAKYFSNLSQEYQNAKVSFERIIIFVSKEYESKKKILNEPVNTIEFRNVCFYNHNKSIIKNFNYLFSKEKVYCICGENGSGKTTLINILAGLYNNEYLGNIIINNVDIKQLDKDRFNAEHLRFSTQNPLIINDTIRENLRLGKSIDDQELLSVLKDLNFISINKDNVLEKIISFSMGNLSGGELQKISLARIFLENSDVYILDEPTTYLDLQSKKYLISKLETLKKKSIVIIISHDEEIMKVSDEIIRLNGGTNENIT
ncbi:ATP-binding cassette domain-containing protein [Thomasclavelia spiroformis]|uniref:ATP-binding cassette domain-containing protein n=1 Tax=Thomasclavelia spiroformis TaxID=29348 RepID=UPI0039A32F9F